MHLVLAVISRISAAKIYILLFARSFVAVELKSAALFFSYTCIYNSGSLPTCAKIWKSYSRRVENKVGTFRDASLFPEVIRIISMDNWLFSHFSRFTVYDSEIVQNLYLSSLYMLWKSSLLSYSEIILLTSLYYSP